MEGLNIDRNDIHSEYNEEPVFYCKNCLSLSIRHVHNINDSEYCDKCGSTNIETTSIKEWEELYKLKFGHDYLDKY